MIFASIDVDIIMHEKALAAGLEAFGLWAWCMCWTQKYASDGRIPAVAIASALNSKPREMRRALDRLLSSGLLALSQDGSYSLHNYGKKNQTAEEIRRKKDLAAERVRAWRERRSNASVTPGERVTERVRTDPEPEPEPEPSPEPDNITRKQKGGGALASSVPEFTVDSAIPDAFLADAQGQIAPTGETVDVVTEWGLYLADRCRPEQRKRIGSADWRGWVLKAISFARERRQSRSDANHRPPRGHHVQSGEGRAFTIPKDMP